MTITISDILQRGVGLTSRLGQKFICDFASAASTGAYKELRTKYAILPADWKKVPQNETLIAAVKAESDRRSKKLAKTKLTKAKSRKGKAPLPETETTMGEVVGLHKRSIPIDDDELVENLARYADGTLTEKQVRARHHLDDKDWVALGQSDKLVELIEARKLLRIRTGLTKKERAQNEIIDAPPILGRIMRDPTSNARHIVDSIKTLDALATGGGPAGSAPDASRFCITINLSAGGDARDVLHYNKSIKPLSPGETDPNEITPDIDNGMLAVIANERKDDSSGGQGHL